MLESGGDRRGAVVASWLVRTPIAHRGSFDNPAVPENSLAAFQASIDRSLPIELDVHVSADGVPVVFHDGDLWRLTGLAAKVGELTAGELTKLRLFGTEERLPMLAEVLEQVSGRVPLLIELKTHAPRSGRLEHVVVEALKGYNGGAALQSFNPLSVGWLLRHAPGFLRGQLASGPDGPPPRRAAKADFVAYRVEDLPNPDITRLRERGMPIIAWTVRSAEQKARAQAHADNYIFEDEGSGR